jgi:hypothetical protein
MTEPKPAPLPVETSNSEDESRRLQLEKLRLEIDVLRKSHAKEKLTVWLPLVSAFVAVGGLSLTANRYFFRAE